jgi:signal transduction histidine kinase
MGFAAVARVTKEQWIACSVLDEINFGLKPAGELPVDTTICHQILQTREPVVIDNVSEDAVWCNHATPAQYGFQSYISMPIILADGSFFGTLCAIDPRPTRLKTPETIGMFRLFADLIAKHLDAGRMLSETRSALAAERETAELREQFIAILAHDLRNPMRAITILSQLLANTPLAANAPQMALLISDSAVRMNALIDNMLDLARGRLAGGLPLTRDAAAPLLPLLQRVVTELQAVHPERAIETNFIFADPIDCDRGRVAQLLSNLLSNALKYGSLEKPVRVEATSSQERFELSVSNAGPPIPPDALQHVFEPFYRSRSDRPTEGLGLGLYIAEQIAMAHGGTLS